MSGRKKLPTNIHMLKGTFRADRANPNEPTPDPHVPDAPDHLSTDALIEWERISHQLSKLGLITEIDMAALAMYCQAWGRLVKYEKIVAEKGELCKTANGSLQLSPAMWVINKAMEQCYKLLTEFGLSPASRTRVAGKRAESQKEDPWSKFG